LGPLSSQALLEELTHRIHSPLAAIRNALYLAGCRTDDPEVHAYLEIADCEVSAIVRALCAARAAANEAAAGGPPPPDKRNAQRAAAGYTVAGHITEITALGCS